MTGFHFVQHEIGKFFGPRPKPLDPCQAQKAVLLFGTEGVAAEEIPSTLSNHSPQWVRRWRERWSVAVRAVAHLSTLSDAVVADRVERFWQFCKWVQSSSPGAVWVNFDETPLWFCQGTGKAHISKKRVRGGEPVRLVGDPSLSRKRITVGLAISTDPTLAAEIPTFAIFHGEQDRRPNSDAWRHVDVPDGVALHWQKSAWMTEELLGDWVGLLAQARDRVFGREQVVVLVWDSFRAHLTDAIKILCSEYKLRVVVVPRGLTSILQGLDTHVNKSFKAACRAWWRRFLFDAEDPREGALGYQDLLHMIRDSAEQALSSVVPNGLLAGERAGCASFLHNGLTNALDGSEDDLINIRHPAVDAGRRRGLPCTAPEPAIGAGGAGVPLALEAGRQAADVAMEDDEVGGGGDPGYGSEWSDDEGAGAGEARPCEEESLMGRIIVERDEWLDSLSAAVVAVGAPPPLGSVVDAGGQRRSTRRVRQAPLKQDLFASGHGGGGR